MCTSTGTIPFSPAAKLIPANAVLYSAGRQGSTDPLDLDRAGLEAYGTAASVSSSSVRPTKLISGIV
jgi:hypothetical protein